MGTGGAKGGGLSDSTQSAMVSDENALVGIAKAQDAHSQQLYNQTEPGLAQAESFYQSLASGDPGAIMRAIAPGAQQINQATAGAKKNIMENAPSGGEKNLALEMADVNKGAQVGGMASSAFLNAPNALTQIAGQGVGESISAAGTGISGLSAASSSSASLGDMQIKNQQLKDQEKGSTLGALGSIGLDAAKVGAGASKGGGWEGALTALAGLSL
jgi:hypothetical protein